MRIIKFAPFLALLLGGFAAAQDDTAMEKPTLYASQSMTVTATVEAVDHETRVVTLRREDGTTVTFTASDEARNLDQVAVGDIVTAEYIESVEIVVMENNGAEPTDANLGALARSEKGEMPGMAAVETRIVTATVEEINIEANTFKLKGPDGSINEYVSRNPENLKRAAVGDLVVMKFTEALAISVTEPDAM